MSQWSKVRSELFLKKQQHDIQHLSVLSEDERKMCIQYGGWGIPVAIVSTDQNPSFSFEHTDRHFGMENELTSFMLEKTKHLTYSNQFHIRCHNLQQQDNNFHLQTEWVEYAWFLGTNSQLKNAYNKDITLREYLGIDATHTITPASLGNELAAVATLIIEEGQEKFLLLTLRGSEVHTYPNCMSTSVSGAMGGGEKWLDFAKDANDQKLVPSPIQTIVREGYEELGIEITEEELSIDGLSLQLNDMQLNFLISGVIHQTKESINKAISSAEDQYEIAGGQPLFVPFKLEEVIPLLAYMQWSPTSAASVLLTLEKHFGKEAIEKEFNDLIVNL